MNKILAYAWLLSLMAIIPAAAQVGPGPGPGGGGRVNIPQAPLGYVTEPEADFRIFKKMGKWEPMAEAAARWQTEQRTSYRSLTLGSYHRPHKNVKVGAFYKLQYGARYDADWTETSDLREWIWRDTTQRPEHVFIADVTPRVSAPFLEDLVLAVKTQYHANTFNGSSWLRVNPDLSYTFMSGLTPVASLSLQWDAFLALNKEHETLYDQWAYLGGLWHAGKSLSLGPRVGVRQWVWKDTAHFREQTQGTTYRVVYRAFVLGLDVVARL